MRPKEVMEHMQQGYRMVPVAALLSLSNIIDDHIADLISRVRLGQTTCERRRGNLSRRQRRGRAGRGALARKRRASRCAVSRLLVGIQSDRVVLSRHSTFELADDRGGRSIVRAVHPPPIVAGRYRRRC